MASLLTLELLDDIFSYIRDSRPKKRRPGYTYELDDNEGRSEDKNRVDKSNSDSAEKFFWKYINTLTYHSGEPLYSIDTREFYPTYPLRPLLLVSKFWKEVAQCKLYTSISLGSKNYATGSSGPSAALLLAQ